MTPETRTTEQILSDIAKLEGELATLKGEPLLIEDSGFKVRECPPGGATFTLSWCVPEDANYTEWYPTAEAAKAKLALFARKHNRAVSDDGFYVDLTAQGCQDSRAYVTRRQVPQRRRIYGGDMPLHQRDSVRGGEFLRRIVEKVQRSPHKLYEFGTLLDERPDSGAIAVVELCDADSDVYYSVALWYADAETARRCLDQQYGLQDGAPKPALERPDSEVVFWWDGRVYDLDAGQFPVWLAGLYDRREMPANGAAAMMRLVCHADPGAFPKGIPSYPVAEPVDGGDAVDVDELYLEELHAAGRIDPSGMDYETARWELVKYRAAVAAQQD